MQRHSAVRRTYQMQTGVLLFSMIIRNWYLTPWQLVFGVSYSFGMRHILIMHTKNMIVSAVNLIAHVSLQME